MAKQIVVTGAGGFIGRNLAAELNARGHDNLLLVDNLGRDDKWRNLAGLDFEDCSIPPRSSNLVENGKLGGCGRHHSISAPAVPPPSATPTICLRTTIATPAPCANGACKHGVRFVYASSAATYGDGSKGYSDTTPLKDLRPLNMYGYSKHMFDLWAQKREYFDRIVGLKYFNVFGPYEEHKGDMRSMVHKAYGQILKPGKSSCSSPTWPEYADGEQMRDFVYVKDAVAVTLHFLEHRDLGGLFNCGTGKARTWNDLMNAVFTSMGVTPQIDFIEMPEVLRGKYQYFTQAEMAKLRAAGYTAPFTSLEDAVLDYVKFLKANESEK